MILMVEVINVCGRSDLALKGEYMKKDGFIYFLLFSYNGFFGINVMCFGLVIYSIFDFLIMVYLLKMVLPLVTIKKSI